MVLVSPWHRGFVKLPGVAFLPAPFCSFEGLRDVGESLHPFNAGGDPTPAPLPGVGRPWTVLVRGSEESPQRAAGVQQRLSGRGNTHGHQGAFARRPSVCSAPAPPGDFPLDCEGQHERMSLRSVPWWTCLVGKGRSFYLSIDLAVASRSPCHLCSPLFWRHLPGPGDETAAFVNTDDDEGDCSEQNCVAGPVVLPTAAPAGGSFTHPVSQTRRGSPVCLSPMPGGQSFLPARPSEESVRVGSGGEETTGLPARPCRADASFVPGARHRAGPERKACERIWPRGAWASDLTGVLHAGASGGHPAPCLVQGPA